MRKTTELTQKKHAAPFRKCRTEKKALQKLIDLSPDVICAMDEEGRFRYVSAASESVWGYRPDELLGRPYLDYVLPDDHAKTAAVLEAVMQDKAVAVFENRYVRKDGTVVPVLWSLRWSNTEQTMFGVAKDATQIKEVEKQQRASTRAYKLAGLAWWEYNIAAQTYTSSEEFFHLYGLPVAPDRKLSRREFFSQVHPADQHLLIPDPTSLHCDPYFNFEHRVVKPSGDTIYVVHYVELIRDENGRPIALHGATKNITEEKMKEKALQLANERYQLVNKATSDAVWDWDIQANTCYFSESYTTLFGHENRSDFVYNTWAENIHSDDKTGALEAVSHALNDPGVSVLERQYRFLRKNGTTAHVVDRALILRNDAGTAIRMVSAMQDTTEKTKAQEALASRERRFRAMFQSGDDLICLLNASFEVMYSSPNYTAITGYTPEEMSGFLAHERVHPEEYAALMQSAQAIFTSKTVKLAPFRYQVKSGEYRWLEGVLTNHLGDPDIDAIVSNVRDVTEKMKTQVELTKLSMIATETGNAIIITDAEERIEWVNKSFTTCTGYTLEEIKGKRPGDFLQGQNTSKRAKTYLRKCVEQRRPFRCEILNYTKDGDEYWIELFGQPIFDDRGNVTHLFAIQNDITERKKAEAIIRNSEEKYKCLFFSSPQPKWICHAETLRITDVNEAACKLYGYTREEFLRLRVDDLRVPEEVEELHRNARSLMRTKGNYARTVQSRKKNGDTFYIRYSSFSVQLLDGLYFITTGLDMTEQLALHKRLVEQKVEAQKEISKAILQTQEQERADIGKELHDNVCQLLTTAKLYIENTKLVSEQRDAFTQKGIELLKQSITEIRGLSHQLVSPLIKDVTFEAALSELVGHYEQLRLFRVHLHVGIEHLSFTKELQLCLYRILQEQFNNTVKYASASQVVVSIHEHDGWLVVEYKDDGVGFDPLKANEGVGLKTIRHRAEMFKGRMQVSSGVGKGYSLRVCFALHNLQQTAAVCCEKTIKPELR